MQQTDARRTRRREDHFVCKKKINVGKEGLVEFVNLDILGLRRRGDITTLLPYGRAV